MAPTMHTGTFRSLEIPLTTVCIYIHLDSAKTWQEPLNVVHICNFILHIMHIFWVCSSPALFDWSFDRSLENPSVTNAISMFFLFTFVIRHLCKGIRHQTLTCTDKQQDWFLITLWFQLESWISMPFCTSSFFMRSRQTDTQIDEPAYMH